MSFYVNASNIHTGESERYGPFPGMPGLTYELLRCHAEDDESGLGWGEHIFRYSEKRDDVTFTRYSEKRDDVTFTHRDDGDEVSYGWRRLVLEPYGPEHPRSFSMVEIGPIWTDLFTELTDDAPIRSNLREDN